MSSWIFFLLDISGWKEDDKLFLETHNFQAMFKKVKNQPYVMFIGVPGSGKTATARHIALKLQEEDGYDILSIKDLKDIDTYCVQNKEQVFVIDDVLCIFGFAMDLLTLLYKFRDTLNYLTMSKTKVIMTCREEVYRNKHIALLSDNFLRNHDNLVLLHTEENALNDQDKRGLLEKYKIDVNALSQADLAATSNMFPYLCRLYKEFSNYGPKFFKSPVPIFLKKLDEMETVDLVQYASLVLMMANQNKMSPKVLEENGDTSYKVKKDEILKRCQISSTTESFEFINALKRMEHTFTENRDGEFTFSQDSMFEMVAYHFGHRNPELMLKYMSSDFIANNITVNDACTIEHESQKKRTYDTYRQSIEQGNVISLSINLQKNHYPHLAKRLYTDVKNGNLHNVFENEALKNPAIVQFFIKEIEKKPYEEIRTVFLSETRKRFESKKKNNDNEENEIKQQAWFMPNDLHMFSLDVKQPSVRAISWVIYYGHYQILQCIVDMILRHEGTIDDLFLNSFNKPYKHHSAIERERKSRKHIDSINVIERERHLLRLGCFSGDPATVKILLKEVHEDVRDNLYEPLVIACFNGHLGIVKELIQAKADVNAVYKEEITPLIAACYEGHMDVVTELIKAGADVNQAQYAVYRICPKGMKFGDMKSIEITENSEGFHRVKWMTPLTAACENGHSEIVELLIKKGADVNVKNEFCETPLTAACGIGNLSVVELLLKNGANVTLEDSNAIVPLTAAYNHGYYEIVEKLIKNGCENGNRTLSAACFEGEIIAVKELITAGANVNVQDGFIAPITAACIAGHSEVVKELILNDADVNLRDGDQLPIITASRRGHVSVVKELINAGVDINVVYKDETPLTSACRTNRLCVVKELIKAGADVTQNHNETIRIACEHGYVELTKELIKAGVDVNDKTLIDSPIATACWRGHVEIVKVLIESGADINLDSSLYYACSTKNLPIVEYLLKAGTNANLNKALIGACGGEYSEQQLSIVQELIKDGADVNWGSEDYESPLQKASKNGHLSIVRELLKSGADVNLGGKHEPPLTMACAEGHLKIVKELVKRGADVNLVKERTTPLTVACLNGHSGVVEELLIAKADVNLGDGEATPLEIAIYKSHYNIVKLLIKTGANVNLIYEHSTPLIAACHCMDLITVQELLQSGANVNLNVEEETPLKAACLESNINIVRTLIKAGADVNLAGGKHSPLSIAYKCCNQDVINVLIEAGADTIQQRERISGCCKCIS